VTAVSPPDIPFSGKIAKKDVPILAKQVARRVRGARFSSLMIGLGLLFVALSAVQAEKGSSDGAVTWFGLGFSFVAVGLGVRWSEGRAYRKLAASTVHSGSVLAEGVSVEAGEAETRFRWSSFSFFERHGDLLILWLKDGRALPLAPELFAGEGAFAAARSRIEAAVEAAPLPRKRTGLRFFL
jgi:hypothetical protein